MGIDKSACIRKSQLLLLCGALVFSGCYKKETQQEGAPSENTSAQVQKPAPATSANPKENTPAPASSKVDVDLYLEVSNGMKGFMPPPAAEKEPTVFQRQLNKLISEVQDGIYVDAKRYYLAGENGQGQPVLDSVSYATLKNTVTSGIKADVRGTPLPAMLEAALSNSVKREAVSVIVSDFIHGPDPNNPGQFLSLDSDIRSSLKQAEHQNLVVAVLGNASGFFGNYYPAVKKPAVKRTLEGEEIPFYIWVIGQQQEVQTVINKVLRNLPAQQAYFGFSYPNVAYSAILKSNTFRPAGVVYCTSRTAEVCTSVNLMPEKEEPVEFTIGLNLSDFPASMQQVSFLKQHLKLAVTGGKASIGTVIAASEEVKATPDLAKYTHFVRVKVPQLTANSGSITLQLPQVLPAWVNQWSTANDNNPAGAQRKTYQLNTIIEGVQALYRDKSENVFSVTMKFNKENK
ncbi:hypothetical protein ACFSC6_21580 [Rufibacter sediminis]|uniref:VWA domain-containing protein n=1 Tax=Rufibacter sediminis TaxID=2762756 RepID=A0ABR6VRA0_9BACT|nr:hypothetical protein [Rufibacter sediminis]MBC3539699.1 hypothetical protein [Rufibacter sediminis]